MPRFTYPPIPIDVVRAALVSLGATVGKPRDHGACVVRFAKDGVPQIPVITVPRTQLLDHDMIAANVLHVGIRQEYFSELAWIVALGRAREDPASSSCLPGFPGGH